jgi:hypothetical protein
LPSKQFRAGYLRLSKLRGRIKIITIEAPSDTPRSKIGCLRCDALFPSGEYKRNAPTATTAITNITVGKTMSCTTTLPSLSWLGQELMPEILAFGVKSLFDCASEGAKMPPAS